MSAAGKPANAAEGDYFLTMTVTVKMSAEQREAYACEYGLDQGVCDDIAGRVQADASEALSHAYWLREFTTFSVTKPQEDMYPPLAREDGRAFPHPLDKTG